MQKSEAAFVGVLLGCIHGFILATCMQFSTASFILYGDAYVIPFAVTAILDAIMLVCVISYTVWVNWVTAALVWLENALHGEDELEDDML